MDGKPRAQDLNYLIGSERTRLINELPLEIKFEGNLRREGFDPEDFGRIVAAGVKIKPELLRHVEMMLAKLTRDERINAAGE
jgi:hypothetical protein